MGVENSTAKAKASAQTSHIQ